MPVVTPSITRKFICIAARDQALLGAVISSYLAESGNYFAIFEFPNVTVANNWEASDEFDEHTISRHRAETYSVLLNNILSRLHSVDNIILAGLSSNQKSYLDFIDSSNVISIDKITEVDFLLSPFFTEAKTQIRCRSEQMLTGLYRAIQKNAVLLIDELADDILGIETDGNGLVLIEDDGSIIPVLAVNYAASIGAKVLVVERLETRQEQFIQNLLYEHRDGKDGSYDQLMEFCHQRINGIRFEKFDFATFFTIGVPYSLAINNVIPCSYVNLHWFADLFVINNLLFVNKFHQRGGIVFSPKFFSDEETNLVETTMQSANLMVKKLYDKDASALELDMNIKEFPFELMHICSHGGELKGELIEENVVDRYGTGHLVQYERVVSFSGSMREGKIGVQEKLFFKTFDGFRWASPELKAQKIPHEVFADMYKSIRQSTPEAKKILNSDVIVTNSCAIVCNISSYQAMFHTCASHTSPIVFNNTCSSWYNIAQSFVFAGSRGYIGTFWPVDNDLAVLFASKFYENGFSQPIIYNLHAANCAMQKSKEEDAYMFWGLHFTQLMVSGNEVASRQEVFNQLMYSINQYERKKNRSLSDEVKANVEDLIKWIAHEFARSFTKDELLELRRKFGERLEELRKESVNRR